ncbi:hypothetical protein BXZ70DRAFT_888256 [Cristinia sonorae]|uniref:Glycosyltransferase family 2 protein n=1 Tax=Cristinia sonorae TaxID=1940300 RepID=A0A8K0UTJ1_9AGAR|nr:hypothetical protein BXZ70DRAFT_888256 [Cristinia sonorae]
MLWYLRSGRSDIVSTSDTSIAPDNDTVSAALHNETVKFQPETPQRFESTLVLFTEDLVRQHDDEDQPVTAILPVTQTSLSAMLSTLSIILKSPGKVSDVILLCPADIQSTVRHALRHLLYSSDFLVYVDIDLSSWDLNLPAELAIMEAARKLSTRTFLILDVDGLIELKQANIAPLLSPPIFDLPLGPRASDLSGADFVCFSHKRSDVDGFLAPPFILPADLLPPEDLAPDFKFGYWGALGKYLSYTTGTGGAVYGMIEASNYLCSSEHKHQAHHSPSSTAYNTATDEDPFVDIGGADHYQQTDNPGTFIFVFPSIKDLRQLYSVVCRLQEEGHHAYSLVSAEEKESVVPIDVHSNAFSHLEDCDIDITVLPDVDTLDDMATSLWDWIASLPSPPDIVIVPEQKHGALEALQVARGRHPDFDAPVIKIPHGDLPFCDWMGALSLDEWLNWHVPQVDVTVITDSRPASLTRLLKSLSSAHFFGDKLDVRINMEQTADRHTRRVVQAFQWEHGSVSVNRRVIHGDLLPAVVESWYPRSNDTYGLILEDDVELSPLFYAWIKMSVLKYRYGRLADKSTQLFGISLYQQKNLELRPEGSRHRFSPRTTFSTLPHISHSNTPYLSQIPCSWGALYFPEHWREFHDYLSMRLSDSDATRFNSENVMIVAPGVRSNKWTRSWKKYFIEMAYLRGYVMLYPNYRDYVSLSTNHLEVGEHVKDVPVEVYLQKKKLFLHPLMQAGPSEEAKGGGYSEAMSVVGTGLLDLPEHAMPDWETLPVLDLLGLVTDHGTIVQRGEGRGAELFGCRTGPDARFDVRTWLCLEG